MRVIIDLDDTIHDLITPWTEEISKRFGVPETKIKTWDMLAHYPTLTASDVFGILRDPELWKKVNPKEGAVETIRRLISEGFDVVICTATDPSIASFKFQHTLFKYLPEFDIKNIVISNRKNLILGDIIVDDAPHNMNFHGHRILFSANHNEYLDASEYEAVRCNNWSEVYNEIHLISNEKNKIKREDKKHDLY
jgi:5'(3')-deoxyribonucleotidase